MSHRRLHSTSETISLSWESNPWASKEKPRISWENRPWASKETPKISWENTPWTSKERPRVSWDNKPWISRERTPRVAPEHEAALRLPARLVLEGGRRSVHLPGLPIPLPPCPSQPPGARSSPKKGVRREEDPFLAAYIKCTRSVKAPPPAAPKESKRGGGGGFGFSCKHTCGVREDGMVSLSQHAVGRLRERLLEKEMGGGHVKGRRSSFF